MRTAKLINKLPQLIERKAREEGYPSQHKDIAAGAGIDASTFSRYVNDHTASFKRDVLEKLCRYYNVPIQEIIYVELEDA